MEGLYGNVLDLFARFCAHAPSSFFSHSAAAPTHWMLLQLPAPLADGFPHGKRHTYAQASTLDVSREDGSSCAESRRGMKTKVRRRAFPRHSTPGLSGGPLMPRVSCCSFPKATKSNSINSQSNSKHRGLTLFKGHGLQKAAQTLLLFLLSSLLLPKPKSSLEPHYCMC